MNIYFLVEGRRTERKVYPAWLSYLVPDLKRVENWNLVVKNNYYLFSSQGYPQIYEELLHAIENINENDVFDYLVICMDAEEETVEGRISEIFKFLEERQVTINTQVQLKIIVQNRCFETWFLGNRTVYKQNPQDVDLIKYTQFYNVRMEDPELMPVFPGFNTHARFHEIYLKKIFAERGQKYSKEQPGAVMQLTFLDELRRRTQETNHLKTLASFFDFCKMLREDDEV